METVQYLILFWKFFGKKNWFALPGYPYNYSILLTKRNIHVDTIMLPWQSHESFIYIYTVRFNQIPCRSLRLHLSLQKKHQQTDHQ
jgi:hypothetical protein